MFFARKMPEFYIITARKIFLGPFTPIPSPTSTSPTTTLVSNWFLQGSVAKRFRCDRIINRRFIKSISIYDGAHLEVSFERSALYKSTFYVFTYLRQSLPWAGSIHGLGWVGLKTMGYLAQFVSINDVYKFIKFIHITRGNMVGWVGLGVYLSGLGRAGFKKMDPQPTLTYENLVAYFSVPLCIFDGWKHLRQHPVANAPTRHVIISMLSTPVGQLAHESTTTIEPWQVTIIAVRVPRIFHWRADFDFFQHALN